jgi:adenylate cyclase class IV
MYEVEFKVELTQAESATLSDKLIANGFSSRPPVMQNDFYIEARESSHGGYDIKRYRDEGDQIFYTEKVWELVDDQPARREIEHVVTREEFGSEVPKFPDAVTIRKSRRSFQGEWQEMPIHIDMDDVKFDHSPAMRYFIEAEIIAPSAAEVAAAKALVQSFLCDLLGKEELVDSPGMFSMAYKRL